MQVTSTIKNVVIDGNGIRVFVEFNTGHSHSYLFAANATIGDITQHLQRRVNDLQAHYNNLEALQSSLYALAPLEGE